MGKGMAGTAWLVLAATTVAWAEEARVEVTREVSGQGQLRVLVPRSWQTRTRTAAGQATTLEFTPPGGDDFMVLLTLIPARREGSLTPSALREGVERAGKRALAQAVEKVVEIEELTGPEVQGFYFSLTDREPGDSYKHLTQGEARLGTVVAAFTIFQRTANLEVRRAGVDLVRTATLAK